MAVTRRSFIAGAAGVVLARGAAAGAGEVRTPGAPASAAGARSPFESASLVRGAAASYSTTPLHRLHGTITPSDLHYEVHHAGVPAIDPAAYRLLVHGLVDRPTVFTLDDLERFPAVTRIHFLECGGNYPKNASGAVTPAQMAGLTSQTEWTGVPLSALLDEVGVRPGAAWFLAEGGDAAALTRSVPVARARADALLAYAQNGEPLRPAQGYPVRLLLPGFEGNMNVKWLRRLEFAVEPFMTRWETSRYTEETAGGNIRQFSFELDARSIITSPAPPATVVRGWHEVRGIAWTGRGRITAVEVSVDDGATWTAAILEGPVLPHAHVRFRLPWRFDGRAVVLASRAIDETGYVQPTVAQLLAARGRDSPSYHLNPIVGWAVDADGRITLREAPWR